MTHPMEPLERDKDGVVRFVGNSIVRFMLAAGRAGTRFDLNLIAEMDFTDDDRMQLAQLIGYSLSGYGELPYVSDESYNQAEKAKGELERREMARDHGVVQ